MTPEEIFLAGCKLFEAQRYAEALTYFQKAAQERPDSFLVLYTKGQTHKVLRQWQQASQSFSEALRYNPNIGDAHLNLGFCLYQMKAYEVAIPRMLKAIELGMKENSLEQAHFNIAMAYYEWLQSERLKNAQQKGEEDEKGGFVLDKPIEHFRKVVELNPKNIVAHFHLGQLWVMAADWVRAEEAYQKVVELVPLQKPNTYSVQAWVGLATAYTALERYSRALICLETAIDLEPRVAAIAKADPAFEKLRKHEEYAEDFYDLVQ
ncbi:tetratricopeptide repeat protein [Hugenholtzia roseola]|uniref:tetratricopeptide repeat protein n=1 Tax=Hugenholtzia roseola TaxID=1002 RepID=UPI0004791866|nr:tetratricopeptide repeat protein [Hugenholtzia roseola]